jgi:hypothetical protein
MMNGRDPCSLARVVNRSRTRPGSPSPIREAIDDRGRERERRFIRTLHGRGYAFEAPDRNARPPRPDPIRMAGCSERAWKFRRSPARTFSAARAPP